MLAADTIVTATSETARVETDPRRKRSPEQAITAPSTGKQAETHIQLKASGEGKNSYPQKAYLGNMCIPVCWAPSAARASCGRIQEITLIVGIQHSEVAVWGRTAVTASSRGCSLLGSSHARSPTGREEAASTVVAISRLMPSSTCSPQAQCDKFADTPTAHLWEGRCSKVLHAWRGTL